jgi:cell volume regulation protein A
MSSDILVLGLTILVGFIGSLIFQYTKIPESLFMLLIGLAVGPIFGVVNQAELVKYMPLIVTITMILVLLDTGLSLNVFDTLRALRKATFFTILVLFFSMFFVSGLLTFLGWNIFHALLMGVISSGTTTIASAYLLPRLSVTVEVKQILFIESIINDLTIVASVVMIVQAIQVESFDLSQIALTFIAPVATAFLMGSIFTFLWVNILWKIYKGEELSYVFTLGLLFVLYSLVELIGGNGAIAVLVLSAFLGNLPFLLRTILKDDSVREDLWRRFNQISKHIRNTQVNFSFFIKNFFFVYLGIIFDLRNANIAIVGICLSIIILVIIGRYVSIRILAFFDKNLRPYSSIVSLMVARGFTATFAALLPATKGIVIPQLNEIILMMVILSTFTTVFGTIIHERWKSTRAFLDQLSEYYSKRSASNNESR